jgi:hypothetical protein
MTSLRAYVAESVLLPLGAQWIFAVETRDADGVLTGTVTPTVLLTKPDGSTNVPVWTYQGDGLWTALYTLAAAGRHVVHVSTPEDALDLSVYASGPTTASGMPTVNDAALYLGNNAGTWDTSTITDALNAERAAQRTKCGERNPYPDDLRQALLRRVHRNLAMRRLPLAVNMGDADSGPIVLPGNDPEVRRFEAPWRRKPMG